MPLIPASSNTACRPRIAWLYIQVWRPNVLLTLCLFALHGSFKRLGAPFREFLGQGLQYLGVYFGTTSLWQLPRPKV